MKFVDFEPHLDPVDRLLELYCEWHESCWDVRGAYDNFGTTGSSDRALAFAAYAAALDREESVARAYADQVSVVTALATAANPNACNTRMSKMSKENCPS